MITQTRKATLNLFRPVLQKDMNVLGLYGIQTEDDLLLRLSRRGSEHPLSKRPKAQGAGSRELRGSSAGLEYLETEGEPPQRDAMISQRERERETERERERERRYM